MYKISFTSGVVLILIDQFFPYISSLFNVFCIITFFPWILPIWPPASHDSEICARTQIRKRSLLNWYSLCNFSTIYRCFPKLLAPNIPWVSRKHYVEAAQGRFPQLFFPRESLNKTLKKPTHPPKVFTDEDFIHPRNQGLAERPLGICPRTFLETQGYLGLKAQENICRLC